MVAFLHSLEQFLGIVIVIPLVLLTGMLLTWRLRGLQIRHLATGFSKLLEHDTQAEGSITHFQAISAVLAGNLGTGNISGMAVALSLGGPGSLVWMWVMGLLGMAIKYAGCVLGISYRHRNEEGEYVGGPMYYLREGLGWHWIARLFCLFSILTAFTVGNLVQVNSIVLPLKTSIIPTPVIGLTLALVVAFVLFGGLARIAHVVTAVVPSMTLLYLVVALTILSLHLEQIPSAVTQIFAEAFAIKSGFAGVAGYSLIRAVTVGFERGVFATDAGTGIAPVLQSGARTRDATTEGLVAMVPPVIVLTVCTITTLVLLVTGAWTVPGLESTNMCTWAFREGIGHPLAAWVVVIALLLFGFTTIIAWAFCAEKAMEYLWGLNSVKWFNIAFVACVPLGAFAKVELVWSLADLAISLMLCCNLMGVLALLPQVEGESASIVNRQ